jgi:hypothetical protein
VVQPAIGEGNALSVEICDKSAIILMRAGIQYDPVKANSMIDDLRRIVKLNVRVFQQVRDGKQKALFQGNFESFELVTVIII